MQRISDIHWRFKMSKRTLQQNTFTQMCKYLSYEDQRFINEMKLSPDTYHTIYDGLCKYAMNPDKDNTGE